MDFYLLMLTFHLFNCKIAVLKYFYITKCYLKKIQFQISILISVSYTQDWSGSSTHACSTQTHSHTHTHIQYHRSALRRRNQLSFLQTVAVVTMCCTSFPHFLQTVLLPFVLSSFMHFFLPPKNIFLPLLLL